MKVWVLTKFNKNLMLMTAVIKAPKNPIDSNKYSLPEKEKLLFKRSKAVAANMTGTAKRKENSTACFLESPMNMPPKMVAAARETPGIMEMDWKRPIKKAFLFDNFSRGNRSRLVLEYCFSKIINRIPPRKSEISVTIEFPIR